MASNSPQDITVSIIIVNYNNFEMVRNCLESLFKVAIGFIYEIILVDNNSTDRSVELLKKEYPSIVFITNSINVGFAKANNQGAKIARGKYLVLLNTDTVFIENTIKDVLDYVKNNNEFNLIGCKLLNSDLSQQISTYRYPSPLNILTANLFLYKLFPKSVYLSKIYNYDKFTLVNEVEVVIGAFMFISKKYFNDLSGFDERFKFYHEDTDLCYRIKKRGGKVLYYTGTSLIHFGGGTTKKYLWFHYKNRSLAVIKFAQKHYDGLKFFTCIFFHYLGIIIRVPTLLVLGIVLLDKNILLRGFYNFFIFFMYPKNVFNK